MSKIKFNVPTWADKLVTGLNTEVNFANSDIENYLIVGSSDIESTLSSIKNFDTTSNIHVLESFDLTLKLPAKLRDKPYVISALFNILKSEDSSSWVNLVKIINHNINYNQAAKILNHMNAWTYCINLNKPVIVIEQNTVFTKKPPVSHLPYQSIISLSSTESLQYNSNLHCLSNTYAYSIDPLAALECFSSFLKEGLYDTLEKMLRIDKYAIYTNKCAIHVEYIVDSKI